MPGTTSLGIQYPLAGEILQDSRAVIEGATKKIDSELVGRAVVGHSHGDLSTVASLTAYQNDIDAQRWMQVAP